MNKKKNLFSIACLLFLIFLTGCENMFFGVIVSSPVDVADLPAKDKYDEIKINPDNEKKIEDLFKDKLWKTTVEIIKNYPVNTYFKITDPAGNIAEFGTSTQLKTYNYKVTDNNWILLKNKTETVAIKYLENKNYKDYIIVMLPGELFLTNSPDIGYEVKMEENKDKVKFENNPEIKPIPDPETGKDPENPDNNPEENPDPVPGIPEEKNFKTVTMTAKEFIALINNENLSKIYMNLNDDFCDNLLYDEGTVVITDDTFTLEGLGENQQFKFEINKIEKKVDDMEQVYVATLNVTEVPIISADPNENIINYKPGIHYLTFEKRSGESKVLFLDRALCPIFITTKEYATPNMTYFDISTDVMTKLISLMIKSEEHFLGLQVPGEIYPKKFGIPILVDNKLYLNENYTTDFTVTKGGFGKLNDRGGRLSACARIEFSNSQFEHIKNKSYDFEIFSTTRLSYGFSKGETILYIGPKDTIIGIKAETIEEFHTGFAPHLNKKCTMEINRVPVDGKKYKLIKEQNNLYKIVDNSNNLFVSFEVLDAGVTEESHSASFRIIESNSSLLNKNKFYMILDSYWGFYLSDYDQNYFIELKWKTKP